MSEHSKSYDPKVAEGKWYAFWETSGFFKANPKSPKPAYCISIPPPNVTGVLHMGHALVDTIQDVLIRWKRMSGFEALWIPGTDHAGIATQTVVERHLIATQNKRRKDFSREEFLAHVWEWKEKSQAQILNQIKKLGCSCDWSRLAFTMDESRSHAVSTMFKKMYDGGLVYQGDRLINWDPVTQTALADDEVEYEEHHSSLWYFRYPLEDGSGFITVATTRPETMLGDTGIAVSPADSRYQHLIGKWALQPLLNRPILIVADRYVDPDFGTGAVKITPAHDPNDYEMGIRHTLPTINIMTPDGKINSHGEAFEGMSMQEARVAVTQKMQELGFLEKIEPHTLRVGVSYRSKAVIEPYLSKQWFVRVSSFKTTLRAAVEEKRVTLIPANWESTYFHWIDNLRDWCISRQLWWGHRIPIWYHKADPERRICFAGAGIPPEVAKAPEEWYQDEDVLDTWFSSSLWPFSILGWPAKTEDLKKFYPNATLITGHDILFFWVARMIFMGEYALGEAPFPTTFLHGLIYGKSYWRSQKEGSISYVSPKERLAFDLGEPLPSGVHSKWEKMSKSKGNILDPLEIIDTYGTDAMRMALCFSTTHARQIDLDRRRFEEFKNFTNKVWNGARFIFMNLEECDLSLGIEESALALEDWWILSLLNQTIAQVNHSLESYAFDKAATEAYNFFWKDFCAYYLELAKPLLFGKVGTPHQKETKQRILVVVLASVIRLMHPMAPFITEELFQQLKEKFPGAVGGDDPYTQETATALQAPACIVAPYPRVICAAHINPEIEKTFSFMDEIVRNIRNIRAEMQIPPGTATDLYILGDRDDPQYLLSFDNAVILEALVRLKQVQWIQAEIPLALSATAVVGNLKLIVPLPEEMREKERVRLNKEKEKLIAQQNQVREKLSNEEFAAKAPPHVVNKLKDSLEQAERELAEVRSKLSTL